MLIAEAARRSGLSEDTIRFYEKSGMLPPIARDGRGWRVFSPDNLEWLITLERLRVTGIPLGEVRRFAASANGPQSETAAAKTERLALLEAHKLRLDAQRAALEACAGFLNHKIAIYRGMTEE
jgi:DNA-binding transcriptional MerR regulator